VERRSVLENCQVLWRKTSWRAPSAIPWPWRPEDFCLQNVDNLSCRGVHPVFFEKSEKK